MAGSGQGDNQSPPPTTSFSSPSPAVSSSVEVSSTETLDSSNNDLPNSAISAPSTILGFILSLPVVPSATDTATNKTAPTDTTPLGTGAKLSITSTSTTSIPASTTSGVPTGNSNPTNDTSPNQPGKSEGLPTGAIAGIVIGAVVLLVLVGAIMYVVRRRSKRYGSGSSRFWRYSHSKGPAQEVRQVPITAAAAVAPPVQFDPPLDDFGVNKIFDQLDVMIMDHTVNHCLGDMRPADLEKYIKDMALARQGITDNDQALLQSDETRVHMFCAIFAYHVYSTVADFRIFPKKSIQAMGKLPHSERAQFRLSLCRQIQHSASERDKAVQKVFEILESETEVHVIKQDQNSDELHRGSLKEVAEKVVAITLLLGAQRDGFVFAFRNKDQSRLPPGSDPHGIGILGMSDLSGDYINVVKAGGSGNTVRAVISPGIFRRPAGGKENMIRKVKVIVS